MTNRNLTCEALDAALADYLEGALADSDVADVELHLSGCTRCAALVRDLESITRTAERLPALAPSRDLWPGIAAQLDSPVVPIASRRPAASPARHRLRMGAVAAGLVGVTALVTYSVTRQQMAAPTVAVGAPASAGDSVRGNREPGAGNRAEPGASQPVVPDPATPRTALPERELASAPATRGAAAAAASTAATSGAATSGTTTPVARGERSDARATFNAEITRLRDVVSQRADQLDPATVAIIENSLKTIDTAIAEARAALARDPASRFLSSQLDKALESKLGLLRTAALLPART